MHYAIRDPKVAPDLARPMFGLVESQYPGHTYEEVNIEAIALARRLAQVLASW